MSPICQRCGGYYIREPCPYCNPPEKQVEFESRKQSITVPKQKIGTIDQLQSRQENLKKDLQQLRDENEKTLADLSEKEKALLLEKDTLEKELETAEKLFSELESGISGKISALDAKEKELSELESTIEALEGEKNDLNNAIANLEGETVSLNQEKTVNNEEINRLVSEIGMKEEEINNL